jgi:hypothetical protein
MKRIFLIFMVIAGLSFTYSCSKQEKDPVLNLSQSTKPAFTNPVAPAVFVLEQANADLELTNFQWSPAVYTLTELESTKYILQMDVIDNTFSDPVTLQSSEATSFSISVAAMNQKLLGLDLTAGVAQDIYFRIISFIVDQAGSESLTSDVLTVTVTPYTDEVVVKPIYLLGDATDAGWDNSIALEMSYSGGSTFSIVTNLQAGKFLKFISKRGAWAPQWGTDANGTAEGGNLVYRPDEVTADPPAIPSPATAGEYKITVDTANLTYTVGSPSPELFMLGDGCSAGWNNGSALPMNGTAGVYSLTVELLGTGYIKFITTLGQWAPMYGTDASGTATGGILVYRPDEATADPAAIPVPATAGTYTVNVNTNDLTYTIE